MKRYHSTITESRRAHERKRKLLHSSESSGRPSSFLSCCSFFGHLLTVLLKSALFLALFILLFVTSRKYSSDSYGIMSVAAIIFFLFYLCYLSYRYLHLFHFSLMNATLIVPALPWCFYFLIQLSSTNTIYFSLIMSLPPLLLFWKSDYHQYYMQKHSFRTTSTSQELPFPLSSNNEQVIQEDMSEKSESTDSSV